MFVKTPKKSQGGSSNRSVEKLPKASQNMTYTMEKFVSSRELAIFDVMASQEKQNDISSLQDKEEEKDFERDSDNNEVEMIMKEESQPRM